ncbi:DUF2079 domain-containing protein [Lyngbya sp. CCY1209]|uniref:DUF2079 domain-containing protein n=1 Tax=Lyngbya sp. CCY1209 TaxID=2886103 RepID=UPI002D79A4A9|nr:DUF2079 domain-containing protein [Lyngbya sp. CCY1209]
MATPGMETSPESATSQPKSKVAIAPDALLWMMGGAIAIFLITSSLRHYMFQSTGFDLGIYDQVTYLMSQGQPPISSILGFHHMGNHAAWSVYPLGLLYRIYPSVYWLLVVQAISLAAGAWPTWSLARRAGLDDRTSLGMAAAYLLYPVVFNINLFDFHPEVMALPALLAAILAARRQKIFGFCAAILWVLGCKAVLSLTIIALGIWLIFFEKRRGCGAIALMAGSAWFVIVTQLIIPQFSGEEVAGVWRYTYLGNSVIEILINLFLKPQLVLGKLFSLETLDYLFVLALPVLWWLSPRHLTPLIPALPTLLVNSLSEVSFQRSLAYQYSIPVIPFLLLAAIASLAGNGNTLWGGLNHLWQKWQNTDKFPLSLPKAIVLWSLLIFLLYGKYGRFLEYTQRLDTWQATREAVATVRPQTAVLTDNYLAPHLTHRRVLKLLSQVSADGDLTEFDTVILNRRHPWPDTVETGEAIARRLAADPEFQTLYQQNDVMVFRRLDVREASPE